MFKLPPVGLYVHYPFCRRKCPYCDFNSYPKKDYAAKLSDAAYTDALISELQGQLAYLQGREISSIFIGGGTPSLWSLTELSRLMSFLQQEVPLTSDCEISLEVNPGTAAGVEFFRSLRDLGINRLSIGVQSFDDAMLQAIGRIHDGRTARQSCAAALKAGFEHLNLDIMHGLPGQTVEQALNDLKTACCCASHLSWYELTLEPDTYFGAHPPALPDEDALADIESEGFDFLKSQGFTRYEISGFTKGARCRHNENYWRFGDYLAVGAGAHGKITSLNAAAKLSGNAGVGSAAELKVLRRANPAEPQEYIKSTALRPIKAQISDHNAACPDGERPDGIWHEPDAAALPFEFMLNRLRLLEPWRGSEFTALTGLDFAACALPQLQLAAQRGLVKLTDLPGAASHDVQIELTDQGTVMLNTVLELFLS